MDDLTGNIEVAELKGGDVTWEEVLDDESDTGSATGSERESCRIHRWIKDVAHHREAGDLHDETAGPLAQNPIPRALTTTLPTILSEEYLRRVGYERVWYYQYGWIWQLK